MVAAKPEMGAGTTIDFLTRFERGLRLPFPGFNRQLWNTLKVREVVCDEGTLRIERGGCDEKVGVRKQRPLTIQLSVKCGGSLDDPVGEG